MDRLQRIRETRERLRVRQERFSFLYLLLQSARDYVTLSGTWEQLVEALDDTHEMVRDLLEEVDSNEELPVELIPLGEEVLDCLEEFPADQPAANEVVEQLATRLESLESRLEAFNLIEIYRRLRAQRARNGLLVKLELEVSDADLEAGRFQTVVALADEVFHGELEAEEALARLEAIYLELEKKLSNYQTTPVTSSEWTAEVALADELLLDAFGHWLEGLEVLCRSCLEGDEPSALESLELLRRGNYRLLQVERLSQPL